MKTSKSSLFLMELVISILFFALASAVCVQLFAKAHLIGRCTIEQNQAMIWTQNLAEIWLGNDGNFDATKIAIADSTNNEAEISTHLIRIYLNSNWEFTEASKAVYRVSFIDGYVDSADYASGNFNVDWLEAPTDSNLAYATIILESQEDILHYQLLQHHIAISAGWEVVNHE